MPRSQREQYELWKPPVVAGTCDGGRGGKAMAWLGMVTAAVPLPEDPQAAHVEVNWRGSMARAIARGHVEPEELPLASWLEQDRGAPPPARATRTTKPAGELVAGSMRASAAHDLAEDFAPIPEG